MKSMNFPRRKLKRQQEAQIRQAKHDAMKKQSRELREAMELQKKKP